MQRYRNPQGNGSRRSRLKKYNKLFLASNISKYAFYGLLGFIAFFFLMFIWVSRDLPTPGKLSNPDLSNSTKILDKEGITLYSIYKDYNRIYVPLTEIPKSLQESTIAAEDQDFYKNEGFSIKGYMRAFKDFIIYRRVTGASTLTQQLVKNVLLSPERSITRKMKEFILTTQVDKRYSKDQILEMYLNDVPYGGTAVGVEAASNLYFGKHTKDLNLAQSAFLAGLPQSPSYYSPYIGKDKAYIPRTNYVLKRLNEDRYISKKQMEQAMQEVKNFKFSSKEDASMKAPHFVMYVKEKLIELFGENMVEQGDLQVKTTLDYELQKKSEEVLKDEIGKLKGFNVGNGAVVVLDPKTGAILTMVGSKDYFDEDNDGNYNTALALRQPGSSLKPIMYAASFEKGYTSSTLLMDTKTEFPTDDPSLPIYTPVNYDAKYRGPVQVRFALANSLNIPAVKMLAKVGIKPVMQKAYDMGIENWQPTSANMKNVGLSLVLGGREATLLQVTQSYSVFANSGIKKEPFSIVEVKDSKGKTLYKHEDVKGTKVLSPEVSFLISHILLDNNARSMTFGTNSWLNVAGKTVAVKTGTTDEKKDNWTIGYTPSVVVGVWVGNNDNSKMNPAIASGVTGAAPIWNKVMAFALKNKANEEFQKPENVLAMEIDGLGGGLTVDGQSKRTEYFMKGTEPTTISSIYKKIKLSRRDNNKLANQDEIDRGDYDLKDYMVFAENDPVSKDGKNRWQEGIDVWLRQTYAADQSKYYPPTETSNSKYEERKRDEDKKPTNTPTPTATPTETPTPTPE